MHVGLVRHHGSGSAPVQVLCALALSSVSGCMYQQHVFSVLMMNPICVYEVRTSHFSKLRLHTDILRECHDICFGRVNSELYCSSNCTICPVLFISVICTNGVHMIVIINQ